MVFNALQATFAHFYFSKFVPSDSRPGGQLSRRRGVNPAIRRINVTVAAAE
jgi:hypothetical protein